MLTVAGRRDMRADLLELFGSQQVLIELVKRDLKVRYKRSVLGLVWTMLSPLLLMGVTTLVFSTFFKFAIHNFPIYMMSAYILWGFFQQGTVAASSSFLDSAGLARKIYVPAALFPLASVTGAAVNLVLSLIPMVLIVLLTGGQLSWAMLSLPVALVLTAVFTYGLGLILATAAVFFNDVIHTYQVVLAAWVYLTPIFYPASIVPPQYSLIFDVNPLFHMISIFRDPIYQGTWPEPIDLGISAAYAFGAALIGWWFFERSRNAFLGYL